MKATPTGSQPTTATGQLNLPFASPLVSFILTPDQRDQLFPLVRKQVADRRGLFLASCAPFLTSNGPTTELRMQAVFLPWKTANKVLRILRAST